MLNDTDLYTILGVSQKATQQEIKQAYNKLLLKYHPDKIKNKTQNTNDIFSQINSAYKILGNPDTRKTYDESGIKSCQESRNIIDPQKILEEIFSKGQRAKDKGQR